MDPDIEACVTAAAIEILGRSKHRIHNQGLDSSGKPLGKYADSTLAARKRKGHKQTDINLLLSGRLEKAYQQGKAKNGDIVLGFEEPYLVPDDDTLAAAKKKRVQKVGLIQAVKSVKASGKKLPLIQIVNERWQESGGVHSLTPDEVQHYQQVVGKLLIQWRNRYMTK